MASHEGLSTGLDPFERFKPIPGDCNIQRGQNHSYILKEEGNHPLQRKIKRNNVASHMEQVGVFSV